MSRGAHNSLWVLGFPLLFFAVLTMVLFNVSDDYSAETTDTVTMICAALIVLGIILSAVAIVKRSATKNKIYFAVFREYVLILPVGGNKSSEYVRIPHKDVTGYAFEEYAVNESHDDGRRMTVRYLNIGRLKITTGDSEYVTQINNIKEARECMRDHMPVPETMKER